MDAKFANFIDFHCDDGELWLEIEVYSAQSGRQGRCGCCDPYRAQEFRDT
jgi:hypothetical protein